MATPDNETLTASTARNVVLAHCVTVTAAFLVAQFFGVGDTMFGLIAGAIIGTWVAARDHHRAGHGEASVKLRLGVGALLAFSAAAVSTALHFLTVPLDYPEVRIPIAALGTMFFPLIVFEALRGLLPPNQSA